MGAVKGLRGRGEGGDDRGRVRGTNNEEHSEWGRAAGLSLSPPHFLRNVSVCWCCLRFSEPILTLLYYLPCVCAPLYPPPHPPSHAELRHSSVSGVHCGAHSMAVPGRRSGGGTPGGVLCRGMIEFGVTAWL